MLPSGQRLADDNIYLQNNRFQKPKEIFKLIAARIMAFPGAGTPLVHSHTRKYIVRHTERNRLSFLPRALAVGGSMARHCILHAILIAKFLVQTPQPPIIIPPANMG